MMLNFQRLLQSCQVRVLLLGGVISFETQYMFFLSVDHEHCDWDDNVLDFSFYLTDLPTENDCNQQNHHDDDDQGHQIDHQIITDFKIFSDLNWFLILAVSVKSFVSI